MRAFAIALVCLFVGAFAASAQTNLYVGSNSSFVTYTIDAGVNVFSNVYVGYDVSENDNSLIITNAGTYVECVSPTNGFAPGRAYIGWLGSRNSLVVAGGAEFSGSVEVGYNSTSNRVTLSGSGSKFQGYITLGRDGSENSLIVSNGAVFDGAAYLGWGTNALSNSILVTGIDSLVTSASLGSNWAPVQMVGGGFNSLTISNGATLSGRVFLRTYLPGTTSSVVVVGEGSLWTNAGSSSSGGPSTKVVARAGGVISVNGPFFLGMQPGSSELVIDGSGSKFQCVGSNEFTDSLQLGTTVPGYTNSTPEDKCSITVSNGGRLETLSVWVGGADWLSTNIITVTGAGSVWSNSSTNTGTGVSLRSTGMVVDQGARASFRDYFGLGDAVGGSSTLTIDGSNTLFEAACLLVGVSSKLTLKNGAALSVTMPRPLGRTYIALYGILDVGGDNELAGDIDAKLIELSGGKIRFKQSDSLTIDADIGGLSPGNPYSSGSIEQLGTGTTTLNGSNSFVGLTQVNAGQLILGDTGRFQFVVGPNGSSNQITGAGSFTANGKFGFDLSQAPRRTGDSWQIVSVGTASYGTNFSVDGFTNTGQGTWDRLTNQTLYRFSQTTGTLSVVSGSTNIPYNRWVTNFPTLLNSSVAADPDGDGYNNQQEFAFNGNPVDPTPSMLRIESSGSNAKISFLGRRNPSEAAYYVMSTTNLSSGGWQTNTSVSLVESADQSGVVFPDTYVRREFTVPASGRNFFRIKAEVPQ